MRTFAHLIYCFVVKTKITIWAESTNGISPLFFSFQKFYRTVIVGESSSVLLLWGILLLLLWDACHFIRNEDEAETDAGATDARVAVATIRDTAVPRVAEPTTTTKDAARA